MVPPDHITGGTQNKEIIMSNSIDPLAARISMLCARSGQTIQGIADRVGISKTHLCALKSGKSRNPSLDITRRLAKVLGVSVARLVGETPENIPADLVCLLRDVRDLTPAEMTTLNDIIAGMRNRKGKPQ
jgi:transcriptional regulator with XRE-family HTH domain